MPFADFTNWEDCIRRAPAHVRDKEAYCGAIKHQTENKAVRGHVKDIRGRPAGSPGHPHPHKTGTTSVKKAVAAASHLDQAVRLALSAIAKRDPVKEEGDKKLKEADGVAAEGAQDDQALAVAFGPDNYDELTKSALAKSYSSIFKSARGIIHDITTERSFR